MIRPAFLLCAYVSCLVTNTASAICKITPTRSTSGTYRNIYDEYGDYDGCCHIYYPILYSSAKCSDLYLAKGQSFDPFVNDWDEGRLDDTEKMPDFNYFSFEYSHVSTISVALFSKFTNVTQLYMNSTHVEEIQQGGFDGLEKLELMQLANNELIEISQGVLNHLSRLIILNMSHNHIAVIESNAFKGLLSLKKLILNHNNVKVLHPNTFPYLKSIEVIDLSYNMIIDVSQNAFAKMSQYEGYFITNGSILDLSHNCIKGLNLSYISIPLTSLNLYNNSLNEFVFFNSSYLHYVSLGSNNISNIHSVHEMLTYLDLRENKIYELNSNLLTHSTLLETLDLGYNYIHTLPDDFFITLSQLRSLSLNNNNFIHIQIGCFDGLYSLEFLNISSNRISEFGYGTFLGLKKLVTLDISNNTLSYLYESTYHLLENLESLYLDHNFIASFDPYDITNHLRALKRISLNDNPWNCKSLLHIFSTLRSNSVTVFEGRAKKTVNINGIPCTNQNIQILDSTTSQSINNNDNKQVDDLQTFKTLLNVIDSQFEEFLKNFSYAPFKELRFLNSFQKTFANLLNGNKTNISNNANFRRLNGTIAKLVSELQSLPDKLANYSVRERNQLREDMFSYFNSELVNSTIGKYFSLALSHLNSLQQFLNADFKNSSFYKLFQNNKLSNSDSKYSKDDLTVFEKFVNHDDRVVTKISGLQNSLNALLVVIIIVLFCLLALFVVKMFNKPLLKFTKRNVINTPIDSNVNVGDNLN